MPEGDTIHRAASRLANALTGHSVTRFEAPRLVAPGPAPGTTVEEVEARGKYLLIHFDDGLTLETHMRMTGSWHLYRPGERWRRPRSTLRALVATDRWEAVCFSAPHVVLVDRNRRGGRGRDGTDHLGPDLCRADPDLDEVVRRLDERRPSTDPIAVALLDQRVFCGVGNVYKSEVLHACGVHPDTPVAALGPDLRRCLAGTAHRLLRANLGGGPRVTVSGGLAVYGRRGEPCRRCGAPVERAVHGEHARSTYWCPRCQPAPGPSREVPAPI